MKTSANKEMAHYYGQGLPYIYRVDFSGSDKNLTNQEIEIGGIGYVLGTDIHPSGDDSKRDVIFLLAEAINGIAHRKISTKKDNPFAYAKYEGDSILLIGRESGIDFTVVYTGFAVAPVTSLVVAGTGGAIGSLIGSLTDPTVSTDPGVNAASMISLLKGIVQNTRDIELVVEAGGIVDVNLTETNDRLGIETSPVETNPAAASANLNSLTRGILTGVNQQVSNVERVNNAADMTETITYLDAGTADERVSTIVRASASLALTYTDTFSYAGSSGSYRMSGRVRT